MMHHQEEEGQYMLGCLGGVQGLNTPRNAPVPVRKA